MASEPQEIAECVTSWLHYKSLTGLKGLFNESSLAVPIAEYLAVNHRREVKSEVNHPSFPKSGSGRPKQLDFVREKQGEKNWHAAYETKFQTQNFERIIFDICRLLCLSSVETIRTQNRYLIYAAAVEKGGGILENRFNSDGGRQEYFESILPRRNDSDEDISFRITDLHPKQRLPFKSFLKENKKLQLPTVIKVRREGWSTSDRFICAVWRVSGSQGAGLIGHKDLKK